MPMPYTADQQRSSDLASETAVVEKGLPDPSGNLLLVAVGADPYLRKLLAVTQAGLIAGRDLPLRSERNGQPRRPRPVNGRCRMIANVNLKKQRPTFLFDGDCSFCSLCAEYIERRIPTLATVVPWQFADLEALELTVAECESAVQWVGADGVRAAGPDAIALLLRDAGRLWRVPGFMLRLPPARATAWPAYQWIAEHRHLMPGGTAACAVPSRG
jgi:predicted DCC family thiol-disulfide oxidoreductase YuxK